MEAVREIAKKAESGDSWGAGTYSGSFAEGRFRGLARPSGASVVDLQTAGCRQSPQMPAHYAKAELVEPGAVPKFFYGKRK